MNLERTIDKLKKFDDVMRFNKPAADGEIDEFQKTNGIELPQSYIELIRHFDGGEIFIPGTIIYGIAEKTVGRTVRDANGKLVRKDFSIPQTLLIFGKVNYGDWMCIDLNGTNEIIQWDHETDEELCRWPDMNAWLEETIANYIEYEGGARQ